MAWEKDPKRQEINQHLHRMHDGAAASGNTMNRHVFHDLLHSDDPDGYAGKPEHQHVDGALGNRVYRKASQDEA